MPRELRDAVLGAALAPLEPAGRVEAAADRLRQAIALGLIQGGDQLPAEADLALQLGVSSMTLRETLAILRHQGLLQTRRGRGGGTFVRERGDAGTGTGVGVDGDATALDALRDLGDEWAALAGTAAALAAQRASGAEVERLAELSDALAHSDDVMARRRADWRFHMQLAAASQSVRLNRAERALQGELAERLWLARDPADTASGGAREHRTIVAAVQARDPGHARRRAEAHVRGEVARLAARTVRACPPAGGGEVNVLETLADALDAVFARLEETRATLLARYRAVAPLRLRRSDLHRLREQLVGHLDELVSGTGVIVAPDVVDVPRWLEWYWRAEPRSPPRRLTVELDPARPEFYDYERAEWFAVPRRTGARSVTGAYVDFGGTEQRIVTLSVPVVDDAGLFLGVAAADVRVAAFQPLLLGRLRTVAGAGAGAAVVDSAGRVILSADPAVLVGERLDDGGGRRVVRRPGLPWALVLGP